jgi:hypothetical protein
MAILAINGTGPAPLLPQFQMAALAPQVQGAFEAGLLVFGEKAVAFGAVLHRLALSPDVAPALVETWWHLAQAIPRSAWRRWLKLTNGFSRPPRVGIRSTLAGAGSVTGLMTAPAIPDPPGRYQAAGPRSIRGSKFLQPR